MKIKTIKTKAITLGKYSIVSFLDTYLSEIKNDCVIAITSKVISICEGNTVNTPLTDKMSLIKKEAEYYLDPDLNSYNVALTIKRNILAAAAGIDESNGNGQYILWPKNPQRTANSIRKYLAIKFPQKKIGVIITDSKSTPLRWGVTGIMLAHSGFKALNNLIGTPDIFGRNLKMTMVNVADGLAAAAVLAMGEGNEQTPVAIIENAPMVRFTGKNPPKKELKQLAISLDDDIYSPLLKSVKWKKGNAS